MSSENRISIITSIFKGRRYLKRYAYHLIRFVETLRKAGIDLEVIIIANDPTAWERCILRDLAARIMDYCDMKIISVERETLYKSWNRGVRESTGDIIGFWNVDDIRNAHAVIDCLGMFQEGAEIVCLPFPLIRTTRNRKQILSIKYYDEKYLTSLDQESEYILVPFFLVGREVFRKVGLFDEQFHITGDFEWQLRATEFYSISIARTTGGLFFSDGDNLSGQENLRHRVEQNIIFKRYGISNKLKPLTAAQHEILNSYEIDHIILTNDTIYSNEERCIIEPKKCLIMQASRYINRLCIRLRCIVK